MLRWMVLLVLLMLSGCAHVPGPSKEDTVRSLTTDARQWQLGGRFVAGQRVANVREADLPDPVAGRFAWQHQVDVDTLWLIGPLGNALAKIEVTPAGVRWQDATGKRGEAADLQALGESLAGIRLPNVAADAWLRGRWLKDMVQSRDAEGRVQVAAMRGWVFEYRYGAPAPEQWPLGIEGAGPDGLWLRVALTEWNGVTDPSERPAP